MNIKANGQMIRIGKHGPDSREGLLLGINSDFITLYTEKDGIVYYSLLHVKYFTEHSKPENHTSIALPEGITYYGAFTLEALTEKTPYPWVRIHLGGPDSVEGVLESIDDKFLTLIFHEEIIRVARYHIKSIGIGEKPKKENSENEEVMNEDKGKSKKKKEHQNDGKKEDKKKSQAKSTKKEDKSQSEEKGKKNVNGEKSSGKDKKSKK